MGVKCDLMRIGSSLSCALALLGLVFVPACGDDGTATTDGSSETTDTAGTTTEDDPTAAPTTDPPTTSTTTDPTSTTTSTTMGPTTEPVTSTTTSTTDTTDGTATDTDTDTTTGDPAALCERLGGEPGVAELIDLALAAVLGDDKINGYFLNADVDGDHLGECLVKQVGAVAGCPGVEYDCLDMKTAHAGLGISANDFMDVALDFASALDVHQIAHPDLTDDDKTAIIATLGGLAPDIVEDATSDATIYQRVARKPGIKALIGAPDQVGSFVANVADDVAINTFFAASNFERLNTCLTRQVAGIDGPTRYGLEVDAPAGIDPGVGAANPCKTMADAHVGLQDADMTGIDLNDFGALVLDLVTAMETAGVAAGDRDALVEVLGTMCSDIVAPEFKNDCPDANKLEIVAAAGLPLPIVDDAYDGSLASMTCADLEVPDDGINFVAGVEASIAADHTFVGDLVIKVASPDGTLTTILSRPGLAEGSDGPGECCGDNSNLSQATPLLFKNGGASDAEQMGAAVADSSDFVCDDEDPPIVCEWNPAAGAGPGSSFSDFDGLAAHGTWRVCVGDGSGGDSGTLFAASLAIRKVKFDPMP
jgi:subtilisin-like proprotein convertase family protein/truncated hemoglobin YjbI